MNLRNKRLLIPLLVVIVLLGLAYYFLVFQKSKSAENTDQAAIENQNLVEKVGKLMELPSETPQIATVSDASKLPKQDFFLKAQNGDKVLIFNISQKAILYRPSINKIIDVATLAQAVPSETPVPTISTEVSPTPTKTQTLVTPKSASITLPPPRE